MMTILSLIIFAQLYSPTSAVVKSDVITLKVLGKDLVMSQERKVQVFSEDAREDFGTVIIPFDEEKETIEVIYARTISASGDTISVTPNAINIVTSDVVSSFPFMHSRKELHISFLSITPGATLEFAVQKTTRNFEYIDGIECFRESVPIEHKEFVIHLPKTSDFKFQIDNKDKFNIKVEVSNSDNYRIYRFTGGPIPPIAQVRRWNTFPPFTLISPYVIYTSFSTWDSLAKYLITHYLTTGRIPEEKLSYKSLKELCDRIKSPQYLSLSFQGYVPIDTVRALNEFSMTFPEEVFRVTSTIAGLFPAFVLRYGFDTLNTPPSLSSICGVIFFDGKEFLDPFKSSPKIKEIKYIGHKALVLGFSEGSLSPNSWFVAEIPERSLPTDSLYVDLGKQKMRFIRILSDLEALTGREVTEVDEEEEITRDIEEVCKKEFSNYGVVKRISLKIKNRKENDKPYILEGTVKFSSFGWKEGKYWIISLPDFKNIEPEVYPEGIFVDPTGISRNNLRIIYSIPRGFTPEYIPLSAFAETDKYSAGYEIIYGGKTITARYFERFSSRFLSADDLQRIRNEWEKSGLFRNSLTILFKAKG